MIVVMYVQHISALFTFDSLMKWRHKNFWKLSTMSCKKKKINLSSTNFNEPYVPTQIKSNFKTAKVSGKLMLWWISWWSRWFWSFSWHFERNCCPGKHFPECFMWVSNVFVASIYFMVNFSHFFIFVECFQRHGI